MAPTFTNLKTFYVSTVFDGEVDWLEIDVLFKKRCCKIACFKLNMPKSKFNRKPLFNFDKLQQNDNI